MENLKEWQESQLDVKKIGSGKYRQKALIHGGNIFGEALGVILSLGIHKRVKHEVKDLGTRCVKSPLLKEKMSIKI